MSRKSGNKEEYRNTNDPYSLLLRNSICYLTDIELKVNIDHETLTYKHWHYPILKLISSENGKVDFSNKSDDVTYILTVYVEQNELQICCSCDRRVDMLCHHAYYGLQYIIDEWGHSYFIKHLSK